MFKTQLFVRVMRAIRRSLGIRSTTASARCVDAVRSYLARSYPHADPKRILGIIAMHGVDRIPLELLIGGQQDDPSSAGAEESLGRALTSRRGRYGDPHPLFSSAFYEWNNPDVAASGVAPWLHYQVFGHREARSPHPLFDPAYMSQWLGEASSRTVVDEYLRTPEYWSIVTSPYLDSQRFLLEAESNVEIPPPLRILSEAHPEAWLSFKLMLIDAASPDATIARFTGAVFLVSRHPDLPWRRLATWSYSTGPSAGEADGGRFTVVPGYLLASEETVISQIGGEAASPDLTIVRLETEYLGLSGLSWEHVDRLVFVRSDLGRSRAEQLIGHETRTVAVAPRSAAQGRALSSLVSRLGLANVLVLPYGLQINIESEKLVVVDDEPSAIESWSWSTPAEAATVTFVIPSSEAVDASTVAEIDAWLSRGASLLTVDEADLGLWPHLLDRSHVVVHPSLIEQTRMLVDGRSLRLLASGSAS